MKRLRGLVAIAATFVGAASAAAQEATISAQDAERLVKIVLHHQDFPSASIYCQVESMDKGEAFVPHYYSFSASCDFPDAPATSPWGQYVVSPRTGDVFRFETCERFRYSELRRIQRQIALRSHTSETTETHYREQACPAAPK